MSDKHSKHRREAEDLPFAVVHARKKLKRLKEDDFRNGYGLYRELMETYKIELFKYARRDKENLRSAFNMTANDACEVEEAKRPRVALAAASREINLALGMEAYSEHPKMVIRYLSVVKSGSDNAARLLADKSSRNDTYRQIKKILKYAKLAKHDIERREKQEDKAPSKLGKLRRLLTADI